jgi:hypothetical protein
MPGMTPVESQRADWDVNRTTYNAGQTSQVTSLSLEFFSGFLQPRLHHKLHQVDIADCEVLHDRVRGTFEERLEDSNLSVAVLEQSVVHDAKV